MSIAKGALSLNLLSRWLLNWCILLFQIELNDSEVKAGLRLAPEKREIVVKSEPVDGIMFTQFRAKVHGTVNCIGNLKSPLYLLMMYSGWFPTLRFVEFWDEIP